MHLLFVLAFAPLAQAQTFYPCEAPSEIRQSLEAINAPVEGASYEDSLTRRRSGFEELIKKYPDDFFARRAHANFLRNTDRDRDAGIAEYRKLLDQHPDDPRYLSLYGIVLIGRNTPEAIANLNKAVEKAPSFPQPHLVLGEIYQYPNFRVRDKHRREIEEFVRLCPDSLDPYRWISRMDKSPFVEESAKRLRALIRDRTDRQAIQAYDALWTLEFKVAPSSEYPGIRKRVEADIERIKTSDAFAKHKDLNYTLASGYKLIGQPEEAKKLEQRTMPPHYLAFEAFQKEHPWPKPEDSSEQRKEYQRAVLQATAEWMAKWPDQISIYWRRLNAMSELDDVPVANFEATCDKLLQLAAKSPDTYSGGSEAISLARIYVRKGVRMDRVPELVKTGLERAEKPDRARFENDLYPRETDDWAKINLEQTRLGAWSVLAEAAIKTGKTADAREPLARIREYLAANKPAESAKDSEKSRYEGNQRTYFERMAQFAEAEKRSLDALAYYGRALSGVPERAKEARDRLTAKASDIWKQLGGTDEGWKAWLARSDTPVSAKAPPGAPQWTKLDKPLPKFEVSDIQGKKWTLADMKGKTTLVTVWASW